MAPGKTTPRRRVDLEPSASASASDIASSVGHHRLPPTRLSPRRRAKRPRAPRGARASSSARRSPEAMGRFHDRHHVWLRSREHGTYLQADLDDGSTLSLHPFCEAVRTSWTVHTIGRMLALHSAANGRYLAATAARFGLGGNRVILRDLDMFAAGWFPDMSASGDSIVLRHSSDQFLRAIDRGDGNGVTVEVSASRRANAHWVVEAIPSTDSIPRLPHIEATRHITRVIRFVRAERASTDGTFPHVAWACFEFTGRSLFNLRIELARRLNFAVASDAIMCVRAGFFGRLTPLVINLPDNNVTMEVIVVTAGTTAAHKLRFPNVGAVY